MSLPEPRHWAAGLTISLVVTWLAGAILLDTVQPVAFDATLSRYVAQPGTISRTRSEGWASSSVGEWGIRGLPAGRLPAGPKVVFWGDSFVEGTQVDDSQRMAQVLTSLAADEGLGLWGVGVGTGGDTLIDSLLKARSTAPLLGEVRLNVFVMPRMQDVLPDNARPCRAAFLSIPQPHIRAADCPPSELALALAPAARQLELAWAYAAYRSIQSISLRFLPGPAPRQDSDQLAPAGPPSEDALLFLVAHARGTAENGRVLFLRLPILPHIQDGAVVLHDQDEALHRQFATACRAGGAGFLDMAPFFLNHFRATGRFAHGFFNSPPGSGHLNEDGHRLVAQAVLQFLKEQPDAILAP